MVSRLQHTVNNAYNRRVLLTSQVYYELNLRKHLIYSLTSHPTHLREIQPPPPMWNGTTDASPEEMEGVCQIPSGKWFVWRLPLGKGTAQRLLTDENPSGDLTINNLGLAMYVANIHIFRFLMYPLEHIATKVNNMEVEEWYKQGSVRSATAFGLFCAKQPVSAGRQRHIRQYTPLLGWTIKRLTRLHTYCI